MNSLKVIFASNYDDKRLIYRTDNKASLIEMYKKKKDAKLTCKQQTNY